MVQILVFGDSIAYGAWDEQGGWVQRLRTFLDKKSIETHLVYNLGIGDDSTKDIIHRAESEMKNRMSGMWGKKIVIFAAGINDSIFNLKKKQFKVSPVTSRDNLMKLVKIARKYTNHVIFIGLNPVDESKTVPLPWDKEKSFANKFIERYNENIRIFCKKRNVHFVDIFNEWIEVDYKNLLKDGLHPNSAGHKKIFEDVSDFMEKKRLI